MENYGSPDIVDIGWGKDIGIRELADLISRIVGYDGRIEFDPSKPDGMPQKLLDTSRLTALGWKPTIGLEAGITSTYDCYRSNA